MINIIDYGKSYLEQHKFKLADEFQHFFYVNINDIEEKFPSLSLFLDFEGRYFISLGPDIPSKVMNNLYPIQNFSNDFLESKYKKYMNKYSYNSNTKMTAGIVQSPFKIVSYDLEGDDRLIKKIIFNEKIKGKKYLSISKYIDEKQTDFIINNYKRIIDNIFYYPFLEYVHFVFFMPKNISSDDRVLASEISRKIKIKYINNYSFLENSYKLPEMKINTPILCVLKVHVLNLLKIDVKNIYNEIINKIYEIIENLNNYQV